MNDTGGKACVVVVTRVTIVYCFSIVYDYFLEIEIFFTKTKTIQYNTKQGNTLQPDHCISVKGIPTF